MNNLSHLVGNGNCGICGDCNFRCVRLKSALSRLAAYEDLGMTPEDLDVLVQAKGKGRLFVLPCAIGDTVFVLESVWATANITKKRFHLEWLPLFGKTVFLTREEAEAVLKKMEED